jgi:hypothetical protein
MRLCSQWRVLGDRRIIRLAQFGAMQDSCSSVYIRAAEHNRAPGEAAKRIHEIRCLALVGNRHVENYIWSLRLELAAVFGNTPIITVDFCRHPSGRLAVAAVESDNFVPELNQALESGFTNEAGRAN